VEQNQIGDFCRMTEGNNDLNDHLSIRAQVFKALDENQLLTAKFLAKIIKKPYRLYRRYLTNLRYQWKYHHENERGSNPSNSHNCKYLGLVKEGEVDRGSATNKGWELSRARNRFLVFRDPGRLGRIAWFETGLLVLNVKPVANEGKAKQLFCNGFFQTGLISDVNVLDACVSRVRVHSGHTPFATSQRLPKTTITAFAESHGIIIKLGDRSHPNCVEVLWEVQREVEKVGNLAEGFVKFMDSFNSLVGGLNGQASNGVSKDLKEDYAR
jgi:hypothetical protein